MHEGLWQDRVNVVLGVWLFLAPFFGIGAGEPAAVWNSYIMGAIVALVSLAALSEPHKWEEWVNSAVGAWLILAPFVLNFSNLAGATWNQVIVGVLIGADAIWAMRMPVYRLRPRS